MNLKNINLLEDIYYDKEYISLYLEPGQTLFEFKYEKDGKLFYNIAIKRPIKYIGEEKINEEYYDLETVYGYGGYYTNSNSLEFVEDALFHYKKRCKSEKIIAEFIRFHPFNDFPILYEDIFDFSIHERDVVLVDLRLDILKSYKSKIRNMVKKSITDIDICESNDIDKFYNLYQKTMKKNEANSFYYFKKELFERFLKRDDIKLFEIKKDDKTLSMGLFLFSKDIVHYHLSANNDEAYKSYSNYALLHKLFETSQEKGYKCCMLGGGRSSLPDDPLFKFKNKFSKITKKFYISGMIYDKKKYEEFNHCWESQSDHNLNYFLKYRIDI